MDFKPPVNPDGSLPLELSDTSPDERHVAPWVAARERATYYWYLRLIYSLYHHAYFSRDGPLPGPLAGGGWGQERLYAVEQPGDADERFRRGTTLAASMARGNHMVIVVRGTMSGTEWRHDFGRSSEPKGCGVVVEVAVVVVSPSLVHVVG